MKPHNHNQLELSFQQVYPKDQDQRELVRTVLEENIMVLAGAGAGKTYELVERMVGLLERDDLDIRNIVAITFTRKAAGELRSRFYERLQAEASTDEPRRRQVMRDAAERIDQCFIGTIHAFCSRMLRERPLEAGLPFDFGELDERDEPRARRKAWVDFVNDRMRAGDARLQRLLELGIDTEKVYGFFIRRCDFPELELKPTTAAEPDLSDAVREAHRCVREASERTNEKGRSSPNPFDDMVAKSLRTFELGDMGQIETQVEFLSSLDHSATPRLSSFDDRSYAYELRDRRFPQLREDVIDPALRSWKQYLFGLTAGIVDEAMQAYAVSRASAGVVTFNDLLVLSAELLRSNPSVRRYFQRRYRTILVDEFQDTDPIQAEILMYLTGEEVEESDWKQLTPRPGSLFVVGDEKQSIYRFRRADVDTFRFVRDRIAETGGRIVHLNTSFRSLGNLCDWLNRTFERVFGGQDEEVQAEYTKLLQYRQEGSDPHCVRKIVLAREGGRAAIAGREADRIADFISAAVRGETEFNQEGEDAVLDPEANHGDFMILTRNKRHLLIYARALESRGIPYDLVGSGDLTYSEELKALCDLLRSAADPADPIPLVAFLRGPLVGLSDPELLEMRRHRIRFDFRHDDFESLDVPLAERLQKAYAQIDRTGFLFRSMTPAAALERLIEELGLLPWTAASSDDTGSSRAGGLLRFIANVRRWERNHRHWTEILDELEALLAGEFEIPGMTLESGSENAVRLMNLHQAKGLQAPVVILADPYQHNYGNQSVDFHVSRFEGDRYLSIAVRDERSSSWKSAKTIAEPEGWEEDEEIERSYLEAEETRLRYVAATRARNLLVVSTSEGDKGPWAELTPFLSDIEELPRFPPAPPPTPVPGVTKLPDSRSLERRWEEVLSPSWRMESVTDSEETHDLRLSGEHRGLDFGTLVHRLFDDLVQQRIADPEEGLDESVPAEWLAAAQTAAERLLRSDLWSEIRQSDEVHTEVAFGVLETQVDPRVIRGRIDLIFRVSDGWKIVDFKTDDARTEEEIQRVASNYSTQIASYAEHWSRLTGEAVVARGLWLATAARWVPTD